MTVRCITHCVRNIFLKLKIRYMDNKIPRRIMLPLLTPAEKAIYDAKQAVEALPADTRLTDAVVLLTQAQEKVADYIDDQLKDT